MISGGPQSHPERSPAGTDDALGDKLAFLRKPTAYAEATAWVEARETHMSWVFLTEGYAYKLKKPVRYSYLDYASLERRRSMCEQEVLLNRRLAAWVYLGVAALVRDAAGQLALCAAGTPVGGTVVEWLVQMRRLPEERMLDHAIRRNAVHEVDAARTAGHVAAFLAHAPRAARTAQEHIGRQRRAIAENAAAIAAARLPGGQAERVTERLSAFLDNRNGVLESRVAAGKIVEGHGDLRPEHVFLGQPAAVIDCIEFDRELRLIDPLEELAFLWMECIRLGAGQWGEMFLQVYLRESGDRAAEELLQFYMSSRAFLRARLALGHLDGAHDAKHWLGKAEEYLEIAGRFAAGL